MTPIQVTGLYYYPIKSCAGTTTSTADIVATGFKHDRQLMVVDQAGEFLTQRENPRLALVKPSLTDDWLTLSAPGMPEIEVEINQRRRHFNVIVWRDICQAVDQGMEVGEWFSQFLGRPCHLVMMAAGFSRRVDPAYAYSEQDQVSFVDGYPFLLISQASLNDLNSRLTEPLPMNRFRPNIVIDGCPPYAEDSWSEIQIGNVKFKVAKSCARCVITTVNQETAQTGKEPLTTLATYRTDNGKVMFGQNLIHQQLGSITVGDAVKLIA